MKISSLQEETETLFGQMKISSPQEETETYEPIAARTRSKKRKISEMKNISGEVMDKMKVDEKSFFYDSEEGNEGVATQEVSFIHEFIPRESLSNEKTYRLKCTICEIRFDNHVQFNKHARDMHGYKLLCLECSQVFTQKNLRKKHIAKEHV